MSMSIIHSQIQLQKLISICGLFIDFLFLPIWNIILFINRKHMGSEPSRNLKSMPNPTVSHEHNKSSSVVTGGETKFKPTINFLPPKILDEQSFDQDNEGSENTVEESVSSSSDEQVLLELNVFNEKLKWKDFIKLKRDNFLNFYTVITPLGKGGFGEVLKVAHKDTGIHYAAKKISKLEIPHSRHEKLFSEMAILSELDHPGVIKLIEVYDHMQRYVLIFQLMENSNDLDQFTKKMKSKYWEEQDLLPIMKQIFRSLFYLRKKQMVHRDIKCSNFLIEPQRKIVKLIDFGTALKIDDSVVLKLGVGTPRYIAPEVLNKDYSFEVDAWSCGVMMYKLLTGVYPFNGANQKILYDRICSSEPDFSKNSRWKTISFQCIDLLKSLLNKDPEKRIQISKCFHHPWFRKLKSQRNISEEKRILSRLSKFKFINGLEAIVNTYIVSQISKNHLRDEILQVFKAIDKNYDGVISYNELHQALQQLKNKENLIANQVEKLMKILDLNKSGMIDYTEFIVGTIDPKEYVNKQNLQKAFDFFDIDHSGFITIEEISKFLDGHVKSEEQIRELFDLVDVNKDGLVSKQQFISLLMKVLEYHSGINDVEVEGAEDRNSFKRLGKKKLRLEKKNSLVVMLKLDLNEQSRGQNVNGNGNVKKKKKGFQFCDGIKIDALIQ